MRTPPSSAGLFLRETRREWPIVRGMCGSGRQRGFSLTELLVAVAIIATLAAIAVPNLLRSRMRANEAAAVMNLKNIQMAQNLYASAYPETGFADSLSRLGDPAPGEQPSARAAGLLPSTLGCPAQPCSHGGYTYEIYRSSGRPVILYWVRARPTDPGKTGVQSYHSMNDDRIAVEAKEDPTLKDAKDED
jgi:type IV pilus assembly protein PilA